MDLQQKDKINLYEKFECTSSRIKPDRGLYLDQFQTNVSSISIISTNSNSIRSISPRINATNRQFSFIDTICSFNQPMLQNSFPTKQEALENYLTNLEKPLSNEILDLIQQKINSNIIEEEISLPFKSGWLRKISFYNKDWCWVVLTEQALFLSKVQPDTLEKRHFFQEIPIKEIKSSRSSSTFSKRFYLNSKDSKLSFETKTAQETGEWVCAIEAAIFVRICLDNYL
eukprot:TRINITY_DN3862_c0_g1_i1.p1 TRINITY_DN3862_c0_g1~~TRINITY_DN3862_c0_g1_i1.p1  ORF type:complete len:228 (-),score=88.09 TRINITY_DN3862_c0_g1_i1:80-763(-)